MDQQEFNRMLREGKDRLRQFREAVKNDRFRPTPWEDVTPSQLVPAVKHIRKEFDTAKWQLGMQVECGCYLGLHPGLILQAKFKGGLENLIPAQNRAQWQRNYAGAKQSQVFAFWRDQLSESLGAPIAEPFNSFLRIALAQQSILSLHPVEWAKTHTLNLIYALEWTLPHLIKRMCDEQEMRADVDFENFDSYCAWTYWRAPKLIYMQPSGSALYDPATAWQREDEETTYRLLSGITRHILDPAKIKVEDLAGQSYVSLACIPPAGVQRPSSVIQVDQTNSSPERTNRQTDQRFDPVLNEPAGGKGNDKKKPPAKKLDLSNYFDQAHLTERQRECISMRWEHGLTVTAIADQLGLARKTVDEHLDAAEKKLKISQAKEKRNGQKARFKPE